MNMGIGKKLLGSFVAGAILFTLAMAAAVVVINQLSNFAQEVDQVSRKVDLAGNLRLHIHRLVAPVNNYLIAGDAAERDNFDHILAEISATLAELSRYQEDEKWQNVAKDVGDGAIHLAGKAVAVLYIDNPVGNRNAAELMKEINHLSRSLGLLADEFHLLTEKKVEEENKLIAANVRRVKMLFLVMVLSVILFGIFLSIYISRSITHPLLELHKGVTIISEGNLSHRLETGSKDEIGELAQEFNRMTESLSTARESLDTKIKEMSTLYQVTSVLGAGLDVKSLLSHTLMELSEQMSFDKMLVLLVDDSGTGLRMAACTHFPKQGAGIPVFRVGDGVLGRAARDGHTVQVISNDALHEVSPEEHIILPYEYCMLVLPFGTRGRISGVMAAIREDGKLIDQDQVDLLSAIAEHVAMAVENANLYEVAKHFSLKDDLTGLYNRFFFDNRLKEETKRASRYKRTLSLVILDIDHLNYYNTVHGMEEGDKLLRIMSGLILGELRATDVVARYDGGRLALILPETNEDGARLVAERIRKKIEQHPFPYRELQEGGAVTVSMGVSSLPADSVDAEALVRKTENALYVAKQGGQNRVMSM
ncbi:MAG: diguanylate cyclase [Nitrospirota bacterium]|nr:diguanylate cyclase [Nitrospirota bacterium]